MRFSLFLGEPRNEEAKSLAMLYSPGIITVIQSIQKYIFILISVFVFVIFGAVEHGVQVCGSSGWQECQDSTTMFGQEKGLKDIEGCGWDPW